MTSKKVAVEIYPNHPIPIKDMMKKAILLATVSALTFGAQAGDWGKAPVGKAPIEECVDLGGEISVGWMSEYYYKGFQFADSSVWADVNYTFEGLAVPVTVGVFYVNGIDTHSIFPNTDQGELYVSAAVGTFAGFEVNVGYSHHFYPEQGRGPFSPSSSLGEVGLDVRRSLGFVDFVAQSNYLFNDAGWYHELGLEKSIGLTDNISLVLAGGAGYSDKLTARESGWNHYYLRASLPIQLNCRTVLTPYIGYHISQGDQLFRPFVIPPFDALEDSLHGGVSLSVSF